MTAPSADRVLYAIVCGAGPASAAERLVDQAQQRSWQTYVIATPAALDFLDTARLEAKTGHQVRSEYRTSAHHLRASLPHANAIVVAPATFNTINKWAHGISDTYALGILAESLGLHIPVIVLPFVNAALAEHFAFRHSVQQLRQAGVRILLGPGEWEPHPPGTGDERIAFFPWHLALDEAERALTSC